MTGAYLQACSSLPPQSAERGSAPHILSPLGRGEPRSFNLLTASPALRSPRHGEFKYISLLVRCEEKSPSLTGSS